MNEAIRSRILVLHEMGRSFESISRTINSEHPSIRRKMNRKRVATVVRKEKAKKKKYVPREMDGETWDKVVRLVVRRYKDDKTTSTRSMLRLVTDSLQVSVS